MGEHPHPANHLIPCRGARGPLITLLMPIICTHLDTPNEQPKFCQVWESGAQQWKAEGEVLFHPILGREGTRSLALFCKKGLSKGGTKGLDDPPHPATI